MAAHPQLRRSEQDQNQSEPCGHFGGVTWLRALGCSILRVNWQTQLPTSDHQEKSCCELLFFKEFLLFTFARAMPISVTPVWPGQPGWQWKDVSTSTTTEGGCLSLTAWTMFEECNGPCACGLGVSRVKKG